MPSRVTITRRLEFDAGHRLLHHEGKCRHLHGHRYVAEIEVSAAGLDAMGRVIDFACVKTEVGGWIDREWDHNMILNPADPVMQLFDENNELGERTFQALHGRGIYTMPRGQNPTAENLAVVLYDVASKLLSPHGVEVVRVRLYETPNCSATYPGVES